MGSITKVILSVITLVFVTWVVWVTYHLYRTGATPPGWGATSVVAVLLALSCTYLLVWSLQRAAHTVARKDRDHHKTRVYEKVIGDLLSILTDEDADRSTVLSEDGIQLAFVANVPVLQAFNAVTKLLKHPSPALDTMDQIIRLILHMRSDVGLSNVGIRQELEATING